MYIRNIKNACGCVQYVEYQLRGETKQLRDFEKKNPTGAMRYYYIFSNCVNNVKRNLEEWSRLPRDIPIIVFFNVIFL